ncbi:MAG: hypothetical protein R3C19_03895 [Planctomycetaceae bacterium]
MPSASGVVDRFGPPLRFGTMTAARATLFLLFFAGLCLASTVAAFGADDPTSPEPGRFNIESASLEELSAAVSSGAYVPLSRQSFAELVKRLQDPTHHPAVPRSPPIEVAEYSARLDGKVLTEGRLRFEFRETQPSAGSAFALGRTNLQRMNLQSAGDRVSLAARPTGELAVLAYPESGVLEGSWELQGRAEQTETRFDLQLPNALLSSFQLRTAPGVRVTSPNALITRPAETAAEWHWLLYPKNHDELTLICSPPAATRAAQRGTALSLRSEFTCSGETVSSVWTVRAAEQLQKGEYQFEVSPPCRVVEAVLDDGTSLNLKQVSEVPAVVAVPIVQPTRSSTVTLHGRSEMRTGEPTELPMLVPLTFRDPLNGTPVSVDVVQSTAQLSVPSFLTVRDLKLSGAQQQDVSFSSDGSQVLQLFQYETRAQAAVTLDHARPLLQHDVLFQFAADQDRSSVRAFARVRALTGSAAELSWKLPVNWQPTDVREIRSNLPLFFEAVQSADASGTTELLIHLRSPVTPDADARIVVQLQSTTISAVAPVSIPRLTNTDYRRGRIVYTASGTTMLSRFPASQFRPVPSKSELFEELSWLPDGVMSETSAYLQQWSATAGTVPAEDGNSAPSDVISGGESIIAVPPGETTGSVATANSAGAAAVPLRDAGTESASIDRRSPQVSGSVLSIVEEVSGIVRLENLAILEVTTVPGNGRFEFQMTDMADLSAAVNGRPALVKRDSDWHYLLVPEQDGTVEVQLHWVTERRQSLLAGMVIDSTPLALRDLPEGFIRRRILVPADSTVHRGSSHVADHSVLQTVSAGRRNSESLLKRNLPTELDSVPAFCPGFQSRWMLQAEQNATLCTLIPAGPGAGSATLTFFGPRLRGQATALGTVVAACLILWLQLLSRAGRRRLLLLLIAVIAVRSLLPPLPQIFLDAIAVWFSLAALASVLHAVVSRLGAPNIPLLKEVAGTAAVRSAIFLCCICAASAVGDETPAPAVPGGFQSASTDILVPEFADENFPILYVPRKLLRDHGDLAGSAAADSVCVSQQSVSVMVDDTGAALARIHAAVVRPRSLRSANLPIPLDTATLTESLVDGVRAFPRLNSAGQASLPISTDTSLIPRPLDGTRNPDDEIASRGPRGESGWVSHDVEYEIRVRLHQSESVVRFSLPLAPSPETRIAISDTAHAFNSATLRSHEVHSAERTTETELRFPVVSGATSVNLTLHRNQPQDAATDVLDSAELTCVAEVTPHQTRVNGNYLIGTSRTLPETIRVGLPSGFLVTGVRDQDGVSLPWSSAGDQILIRNEDSERTQLAFSIALTSAQQSPALNHAVDVNQLADVCGQRCGKAVLAVRTVSPFVLRRVTSDGFSLNDFPVSEAARVSAGLRVSDRTFDVSSAPGSIQVELAEQTVTREARLTQQATVTANGIAWNCRCEIEVTGAPIFRQNVRLEGNLQLNSVMATAADTRRLQSYSLSGGILSITFREATRGTVRITVSGTIPVNGTEPVTLPVIDLPDAEILEYSLLLNAEPSTRAYISDLAGAVPDSPILIEDTPLTVAPIRMTVIQEDKPLSLRMELVEHPTAEIFVIQAGIGTTSPPVAHVVMRLTDLRDYEPTLIRLPAPGLPAREPVLVQQGVAQTVSISDGVLAVRTAFTGSSLSDEADAAMLVIPNVPLQRDATGLVSCRLPTFESDVNIVLREALDFAEPSAGISENETDTTALMRITAAMRAAGLSIPETHPAHVPVTFDSFRRDAQFRPVAAAAQSNSSQPTDSALYAIAATQIDLTDASAISGRTEMLAFSGPETSAIEISVPEPLLVEQVFVDGRALPLVGNTLRIPVPAQQSVAKVDVYWMTGGARESLLWHSTDLPRLRMKNAVQQDFVRFESDSDTRVERDPAAGLLSSGDMSTALRERISEGLSFVESGAKSGAADTTSLPLQLPPLEFAGFNISHLESSDRSSASEQTLQAEPVGSTENTSGWQVATSGRVRFHVRRVLRPLEGITLLSLAALAVTVFLGRRTKDQLPTASAEASTVISRDSANGDSQIAANAV